MTNQEFIESVRLKGEEWRECVDWGRYAVSNFGRVASLGAPYFCGGRIYKRKPQLLSPRSNQSAPPYLSVVLSDGNGGRKAVLVHILVAKAFIPNPSRLPYINHKDENSLNNRADNLEWCTHQYNCNYGTHNARMAKTISETAYQRKNVVQLSSSGEFISKFVSIAKASRVVGISRSSISGCCRGLNQTASGYRWMYLSDYENLVSMSKNSS